MVNAGAIVCTSLIKVKAVTLFVLGVCFLRPVCVSFPLKPSLENFLYSGKFPVWWV